MLKYDDFSTFDITLVSRLKQIFEYVNNNNTNLDLSEFFDFDINIIKKYIKHNCDKYSLFSDTTENDGVITSKRILQSKDAISLYKNILNLTNHNHTDYTVHISKLQKNNENDSEIFSTIKFIKRAVSENADNEFSTISFNFGSENQLLGIDYNTNSDNTQDFEKEL